MTFTLNTITLEPMSKEKPKNAVILCHGYGGDGKDISILANYWRAHLPETIFLCPNAPERCAASPSGYQWFDLMDETQDQVLSKSLIAEKKLNTMIDEVKNKFDISSDKIIIGGFSQGCMLSLQTGIKRKDKINSIIGYSGKIISTDHLSKNINSRPDILLMHGDMDQVVTIDAFLEAKEFFGKNNYKIMTKIFKNCEHRIPTEGSSLGLQFIKNQFKL